MWFNKMEIDVIKYMGGPNHITILYKNSDSKKLYVFYCYTGKPLVDIEEDRMVTTLKETVVRFHKADIIIPINTYKSEKSNLSQNHKFHFLQLLRYHCD